MYLSEVVTNSASVTVNSLPVTEVMISQTELSCVVPETVIATHEFDLENSEATVINSELS